MRTPSVARSFRRTAVAAAALLCAPPPGRPYPDGPPPGHTGGFGEPTCRACHADHPLDAAGGSLALSGLPPVYAPGTTYRVTMALRRPGMLRAGFQLAARLESGEQAGRLRTLDSTVALAKGTRGIVYAQQTRPGSTPVLTDAAQWTFEWTSPGGGVGAVLFHAAANAANDDASELGDFIYTLVARAAAPPPR